MRFAGTKRNTYTSEKVRQMRSERKTKKASVPGKKDVDYQQSLGDLIGAGHLMINGFYGISAEMNIVPPIVQSNGAGSGMNIKRQLTFNTFVESGRNERPHVQGYLSSGHPNDPVFRIKGWFNDDGVLRIELVKSFDV
jgi:hypothetical protein